jgi:hypothetical protein
MNMRLERMNMHETGWSPDPMRAHQSREDYLAVLPR